MVRLADQMGFRFYWSEATIPGALDIDAEERALLRATAKGGGAERFATRQPRRNSEALRAMEWKAAHPKPEAPKAP